MKNRLASNVSLLMVLVLVLLLFAPFVNLFTGAPAYAQEIEKRSVEREWLARDEVRLNQHVKATKTKVTDKETEWEAVISLLPQTLDDLETKITVEWLRGKSTDGVVYWETGNNVYYAKITSTRVSAEKDGVLSAWDPTLFIGDTELELLKGPTLVNDPLNDYYGKNTIQWTYRKDGGFFGKDTQITRYVRQIEGLLQEFYIVEKDPGDYLRIANNYVEDEGFIWANALWAQDAQGRTLRIEGDDLQKVVPASEFSRSDVVYPITIDPTMTFQGNYRDGWLTMTDASYSTASNSASADYLSQSFFLWVGQSYVDSTPDRYWIDRSGIYFDTSSLPDTAGISYAQLRLYVHTIGYDGAFDSALQIQSGMPTYPRDPLVKSDYNKSLYSGAGLLAGQYFDYASVGYNTYTLSATGIGWIDKTSWTKLMLRSTDDIAGAFPGVLGERFKIAYRQAEYGADSQPQLLVTYTVPTVKPIVDTWSTTAETGSAAVLHGYMVDDGGAASNVWFDYGTSTTYGDAVVPEISDGYVTELSWSGEAAGLEFGTLYHYTARAQNSAGTSDADDETFLTLPDHVTGLAVTPGDTQNALVWTKGTGSGRTLIRSSTTGIPTSTTDGDLVYFDAGTSTTDTPLTNGTPYYYSAWAEVTSGGYQQYSTEWVTGSGVPVVAGPSTVLTNDASDYTADPTVATLNGELVSLGGEGSVTLSFLWDEFGDGFINETSTVPLTAPGFFSIPISGLAASTQYEFKAKADGNGIAYGSDKSFTTGDPSAANMTTQSAKGVSQTEATLWGKVNYDGGATVTAYFRWGESTSYGTTTSTAAGLVTGDLYFVTLTNLSPSTAYHFIAVGENDLAGGVTGTGFGLNQEFTTTAPSAPTATTISATDIGATSATLRGQIDTDGGVETSARFVWSTNSTLAVNSTSSGWQAELYAGHPVSHLATNMSIDTAYYFRIEAQNAGGSVNGTILSFSTVFVAPTDFAATPLTSASISLVWEPQSDKTLVMAKAGAFPTDRLDGDQAYFGSGASATYDGLLAGTTYFFRAWSWRAGDVYTSTYAEDAATTTSGALPGAIETVGDQLDLATIVPPESWWRPASSDNINNWPLVPFIDSIADDMGMSRDSMWTIVAGLGAVLIGVCAAMFIPTVFAAYVSVVGALLILSAAGVLVGWLVATVAIVGLALIIILNPSVQGGAA